MDETWHDSSWVIAHQAAITGRLGGTSASTYLIWSECTARQEEILDQPTDAAHTASG
jgi:hypothetical protein